MADEDTNSNLTIYNRDYVDGAGLQATPCGGNCPSKPESAINIGLLSLGDCPRGEKRGMDVERCEGSLICSLVSDNHCTLGSQPTLHNASSRVTNDMG